jgi:hypothetical protein
VPALQVKVVEAPVSVLPFVGLVMAAADCVNSVYVLLFSSMVPPR